MVTPVCLNSTLSPSRVLRGDTTQPQQSHVELLALDSASKTPDEMFHHVSIKIQ